MDVGLFDFDLPKNLIAAHPASPRDRARLLDVSDAAALNDRLVRDLPDVLRPGDVMISNDTRVIPARLRGKRGTASVEVTLHKQQGLGDWHAFARPAKKLKIGDILVIAGDFQAEITAKGDAGEVGLRFNLHGVALIGALQKHGIMPLPPYIRRDKTGDDRDREDYQTIFARRDGAVAAPTAGLHFTDRLLNALDERGVIRKTLTLHVGAGTFLPVSARHTEDHKMHAEWGEITPEVADEVNQARRAGGRLLCIGTTSLRLIESAAQDDGTLLPFRGETDIFITPGYRFKAADMLMTNFHLPRSTLFMLVGAFSGLQRMRAAYAHAIAEKYRFYSYGDACLLARSE